MNEAFAPRAQRPRGRLILSFRQEWLPEFDGIRKSPDLMLDVKHMMLHPLDRSGVVEAIEGPAAHFGLVIKPDRNSMQAGERTLAEFLTNDLFDTLANPRPSRNRRSPPRSRSC